MAYLLRFDGVNDYVLSTGVSLTSNFEIEVRFKSSRANISDGRIFSLSGTGDRPLITLGSGVGVTEDDNVRLFLSKTVGANEVNFTTTDLQSAPFGADVWTVARLSLVGTNVELFIDDVSVFTGTWSGAASYAVTQLSLGAVFRSSASNHMEFDLDYCLIRNSGTVVNRWDASASNGTGSILPDTVGANNGTLVNFPTDDSQWVWYSQFAIDPTQWSRRVQITEAATSPTLSGYVGLITEANLPAEIWTTAESSGTYLQYDGDSYVHAPTLGNVLDESTFRIETENFYWDLNQTTGYWFSQASLDANNREIGVFAGTGNLGFYLGGQTLTIVSSAELTAEFGSSVIDSPLFAFEVNLSTGAYQLENNGNVFKTGTATVGTNRLDGCLFRIGARSNSNIAGNTSGAYIVPSGTQIGKTTVYLSGAKVREYNPAISNDTTLVDEINPANNGTLVNFPVSGNYFFTANGGGDLRLCLNSDGTNQLPLEVVSFDTQAQKAVIWTRFPTFASGTSCWLFYGKAGETQPPVTDTFGRNAVWVDYELVSHDGLTDSSGNTTLTQTNTTVDTGVFSNSLRYNGVSARTDASINPTFQGGTLQSWFSVGNTSTNPVISIANSSLTNQQIRTQIQSLLGVASTFDGTLKDLTSNASASIGVFSLIHTTYTPTGKQVFLDGGGKNSDSETYSISGIDRLTLGTTADSTPAGWFNGLICESWYTENIKSDDLISTEYTNQSSPSTFWSTGTPENTTGGGGPVTRTGQLSITLDPITATSVGETTVTGQLSVTLDPVTATSTASVTNNATLNVTLDDLTLSASTSATNRGQLSVTLDPVTATSVGETTVTGQLSVTLDDVTVQGESVSGVTGQLNVTLDDLVLVSNPTNTGQLNVTLDDLVLVSKPEDDDTGHHIIPPQDGYLDDDDIISVAMAFLNVVNR